MAAKLDSSGGSASSSASAAAAAAAATADTSAYTWLAVYFCLNLTLTIYNKMVMSMTGFHFPWMLTALHTFCGTVGCFFAAYVLRSFHMASLTQSENMTMLAFSVLYTLNIAISNLSLDLVSVPMHQIIRAVTPIFTIIISIVFLGKTFRREIYVSLIPIILGVGLATFGDYNATAWGFFLTLSGALSAAIKTIATNRIQVGSLKLHPMDLLLRMSPLAFIQCMFFGYLSGEWEGVANWNAQLQSSGPVRALWMNGVLAFFLNYVSFTANKKTSALTMTVAGNVKQVLSIVLSVLIFNLAINSLNVLGIIVTLGGGAWYTYLEYNEKQARPRSARNLL